jgi:hypothetical protein
MPLAREPNACRTIGAAHAIAPHQPAIVDSRMFSKAAVERCA